jgi:hypothetical protein
MRDAMHDAIRERAEGATPRRKVPRLVVLIVSTVCFTLGGLGGLIGSIMLQTKLTPSWPDAASMCCALAGFLIGSVVGAAGAVIPLGLLAKLLQR